MSAGPAWTSSDGTSISCRDKLRALDENMIEAQQVLQDAFEDAVLMGVDPESARRAFVELVANLQSPHA